MANVRLGEYVRLKQSVLDAFIEAGRVPVDCPLGHGNRAARRDPPQAGPEYELEVGYDEILPQEGTRVFIVEDARAVSFDTCAQGTRLQSGRVSLFRFDDDESACIMTDDGAWAAVKVVDTSGSGYYTFDVKLFAAGS
jgi:hypothetical protein